jgi:hypothetical protein
MLGNNSVYVNTNEKKYKLHGYYINIFFFSLLVINWLY